MMRLSMLMLVALDCASTLARSHSTNVARVIDAGLPGSQDIGCKPR